MLLYKFVRRLVAHAKVRSRVWTWLVVVFYANQCPPNPDPDPDPDLRDHASQKLSADTTTTASTLQQNCGASVAHAPSTPLETPTGWTGAVWQWLCRLRRR